MWVLEFSCLMGIRYDSVLIKMTIYAYTIVDILGNIIFGSRLMTRYCWSTKKVWLYALVATVRNLLDDVSTIGSFILNELLKVQIVMQCVQLPKFYNALHVSIRDK